MLSYFNRNTGPSGLLGIRMNYSNYTDQENERRNYIEGNVEVAELYAIKQNSHKVLRGGTVEDLLEGVENLEGRLGEMEDEIDDLKNTIEDMENSNVSLKIEIEDLEITMENLRNRK